MKLTKIVMGCALAAGLMAFTTSQAAAATFVGSNTNIWTTFSVKGKVTYQEASNGVFKTHSISSKDLLKDLGFSKDVTFAIHGANNDVWVYNTKTDTGLINLSAETSSNASAGIELGGNLSNVSAKNGTVTRNEAGIDNYFYFNSTVGAASGQPVINTWFYSCEFYSDKTTSKQVSNKLDLPNGEGSLSVGGITVTGNSPLEASLSGSGKLKL